ncbi:MAG: hypothetical protein KGI10_00525 [Thaumarchaeota archaeon]|nr:hypothetical protein [Nitrososphaerota archaeon]
MTFQEKTISRQDLEKFLKTLDSDEGIRIDNGTNHIFVNKTSKRYCVDMSTDNKDEFVYKNSAAEVMDFLKDYINQASRIFAY